MDTEGFVQVAGGQFCKLGMIVKADHNALQGILFSVQVHSLTVGHHLWMINILLKSKDGLTDGKLECGTAVG